MTKAKQKQSDRKNKTKLTQDDLQKILTLVNSTRDMLREMSDGWSVQTSTLAELETAMHRVHGAMNFRPQKDEDSGNSAYWADLVLPEDPKAWFYEPK
jgi:hypothetical protein